MSNKEQLEQQNINLLVAYAQVNANLAGLEEQAQDLRSRASVLLRDLRSVSQALEAEVAKEKEQGDE